MYVGLCVSVGMYVSWHTCGSQRTDHSKKSILYFYFDADSLVSATLHIQGG